jgi:hypothetical protein
VVEQGVALGYEGCIASYIFLRAVHNELGVSVAPGGLFMGIDFNLE